MAAKCWKYLNYSQFLSESANWMLLDSFEGWSDDAARYQWADFAFRQDLRRQRIWKDRQDPFADLTPQEIRAKYKFCPETIMDMCSFFADLHHDVKRQNPLTVKQQLCVALYFFTRGKH